MEQSCGEVEECGKTVLMLEQCRWNSVGGTLRWKSGTFLVEQCGGRVEQCWWNSVGETGGYRGLQGVTGITTGYRGLQRVTQKPFFELERPQIHFLGLFCIKTKVEEIKKV